MGKRYNRRIISVYFIFLFLFLLVAAKIIYLQVFRREFFQNLAQSQHYRLLRLSGRRGVIFDRQGRVLATDIHCYSVFADPSLIHNPRQTAKILAADLDLFEKGLLAKLRKKKRFVWIKRKISWEDKERIRTYELKGIGFIRESKRYYPQEGLTSTVLGAVNIDNKGLEGIELFYDNYLRGKDGWVKVLQDSASREILLSSQVALPKDGADLILTLDAQIQYWVERFLKNTIQKFKAKEGAVIVMDASSGQILALANYPGFNPNRRDKGFFKNIRNRAICDMFEPGSVFKVVTLIAAVSEGKFLDTDKFFCENGKFRIPGTVLNDWKPYGELNFREVFMKSSNIGVAKVVQSLGPDVFFRYAKRLGFGRLSGVDFPGEAKGILKPLNKWSKTSAYIIPIGQEIGVNILQLTRTFAAVANGGYLVKPYFVKDICLRGFCRGTRTHKKRVIRPDAAEKAKDILMAVVREGTGKRAAIADRKIGGKTGTAQKYDPGIGRYSPSKHRATFVGFIADMDPPLVIGVSIDEPRKSHFGGVVAAPLFKEISQKVIKYIETEKF